MKNNILFAIILIGLFVYLAQGSGQTIIVQSDTQNTAPIGNLVDADVSFTGVNKFVPGTSLTGELVRIFRLNGGITDLGTKTLNQGTLSVTPNVDYKFYFYMNSTGPAVNFYVSPIDYTAKVQDSVDNIIGQGCTIDTNPVVTVRNPNGITQTSRVNAFALGATSTVDFEIDVKVHSDECYGTPGALKSNIVCFVYDATDFSNVKANTNGISIPNSIAGLTKNSDQDTTKCYAFSLLQDAARDTLTVTVTSNGDPEHNITIFTDDIAFDINANDLSEIWDYTDEDGNQLARVIDATPDGRIYIS